MKTNVRLRRLCKALDKFNQEEIEPMRQSAALRATTIIANGKHHTDADRARADATAGTYYYVQMRLRSILDKYGLKR